MDSTRVTGTKPVYYVSLVTAWVSGLFSVVFLGMLLWSYFSPYTPNLTNDPAAQKSVKKPDSPPFQVFPTDQKQFVDLKAQIQLDPENEELKTKIRELDRQLRDEFFFKRRQNRFAAMFFLVSTITLIIAARTAATLRRKIPDPRETDCACRNRLTEHQRVTYALLGLGLVACFALGIVFGLKLSGDSEVGKFLVTNIPTEDPTTESGEESVKTSTSGEFAEPETPAIDPTKDREAFLAMFDKQWPGFRGPDSSGTSRYENIPTEWDVVSGKGVRWKVPVPLSGNSSPVVWEKRLFLTGADEKTRKIYCFDTETGNLLWDVEAPGTPESTASVPSVNEDTGYAASTPVTDGIRVYAIFANGDVAAADFRGNIIWSKSLGIPDSAYGYAASLAIWFDRVIVQYDVGNGKDGKSRIMALDGTTGEVFWETSRATRCSWPSPIVCRIGDSWQIITSADPFAIAYRPEDGSEIWRCKCLSGDVGPTPVAFENIAYVANEYPQMSAIDATQTGEIKEIWSGTNALPDTPSPLAGGKFVFTLASYGYLTAYNIADQAMAWELEVGDGASFYSSPSLVAGKIYCFDHSEDSMNGYVIEPGETEGTVIAANPMGEPVVTSPAFADGRFYIRGKTHLLCIEMSE